MDPSKPLTDNSGSVGVIVLVIPPELRPPPPRNPEPCLHQRLSLVLRSVPHALLDTSVEVFLYEYTEGDSLPMAERLDGVQSANRHSGRPVANVNDGFGLDAWEASESAIHVLEDLSGTPVGAMLVRALRWASARR